MNEIGARSIHTSTLDHNRVTIDRNLYLFSLSKLRLSITVPKPASSFPVTRESREQIHFGWCRNDRWPLLRSSGRDNDHQ